MLSNTYRFSRHDLPINTRMKNFWNDNGYLIIENFYSADECDNLKDRANYLIDNFDQSYFFKSVFDTANQKHAQDEYFLNSGEHIRFFFESKALDEKGNFNKPMNLIINKIGHALHEIDLDFYNFSHRDDLDIISRAIGI